MASGDTHMIVALGCPLGRLAMLARTSKYARRVADARNKSSVASYGIRDRSTFLLIIGATFGLQALTLVTGIIIARMLGPEGRGVIALVFALGQFGSQLTFGGSFPNAIAKNLAERQVAARDGLRAIVRRRFPLLVVPCLAVGGCMVFLARANTGGERFVLAAAAFVMALQMIVFVLLVGALQGEGRLVRMAWAGVIPQFLFTVVLTTVWLADWKWNANDVLLAFFATSFIGVVFAYSMLVRPTRLTEDQLDEKVLFHEARRSYVSSVRPLDSLGIDRILVGGMLGASVLGLYAAATAVANLCSLVGNAVTIIVLPRVAMHHGDVAAQRAVTRRWTSVSAAIIVVLVIGLEIVVAPLIRIAFGREFEGAIECARWLIIADGFMAFRKVLIAVLQGQGRGGNASRIELALLPLMLLGMGIGAKYYGLVGVGVSIAVIGLIACIAFGRVVAVGRTEPTAI